MRDVRATRIPSGEVLMLPMGTELQITQSLGGNLTVRGDAGLFLIAAADGDALGGYVPEEADDAAEDGAGGAVAASEAGGRVTATEFSADAVWAALRGCYDPEIPLNIVDLGLVYDMSIETSESGKGGRHRVEVKMTLTAPGCGMGPAIAEDARGRIAALPDVEDVKVHIVWDPVWVPQMISEAGRKKLGLE